MGCAMRSTCDSRFSLACSQRSKMTQNYPLDFLKTHIKNASRNLIRSFQSQVCILPRALLILSLIMECWKKVVFVFIALWLPLQGYGAVAMPFCDHGPSMPDSSAAVSAHANARDGNQGHVAKPTRDHATHDHATSQDSSKSDKSSQKHAGLGCNDCGPCQLACAPLIFSTAPHISSAGSPVYDPLPIASLASFSPEQLQRPPVPAFV